MASTILGQIEEERAKQTYLREQLENAQKRHREYTKQQNKLEQLQRELAELTRINTQMETDLVLLRDIVTGKIKDPRIEDMEIKVTRARLQHTHLTHEWDTREQRTLSRLLQLEQEHRTLLQQNKELEDKLVEYNKL